MSGFVRSSAWGVRRCRRWSMGFTRAYNTIFDFNVAAFLAHVMLFVFGSGPVRGFAVTITVGIATSMFTAWMLTRLLVSRWYIARRPQLLPV